MLVHHHQRQDENDVHQLQESCGFTQGRRCNDEFSLNEVKDQGTRTRIMSRLTTITETQTGMN